MNVRKYSPDDPWIISAFVSVVGVSLIFILEVVV